MTWFDPEDEDIDQLGEEIRLQEELDEIHRDLDFEEEFPFGLTDED